MTTCPLAARWGRFSATDPVPRAGPARHPSQALREGSTHDLHPDHHERRGGDRDARLGPLPFKPTPVTPDQIRDLIAAAVRSPTARHAEPWVFAVIQSRATSSACPTWPVGRCRLHGVDIAVVAVEAQQPSRNAGRAQGPSWSIKPPPEDHEALQSASRDLNPPAKKTMIAIRTTRPRPPLPM